MSFQKTLLVALLVGLLGTACSQQEEHVARSAGGQESSGEDSFSQNFVKVVLPGSIDLIFPYDLAYERLYSREETGEIRRGLMLHLKSDVSVQDVGASIRASFTKAGYKPRRAPSIGERGQISFTLDKKGETSVYVVARPASSKLAEAGLHGTVWLSWKVRGAGSD